MSIQLAVQEGFKRCIVANLKGDRPWWSTIAPTPEAVAGMQDHAKEWAEMFPTGATAQDVQAAFAEYVQSARWWPVFADIGEKVAAKVEVRRAIEFREKQDAELARLKEQDRDKPKITKAEALARAAKRLSPGAFEMFTSVISDDAPDRGVDR